MLVEKFFLRVLMGLGFIFIMVGLWGFSIDPVQGIAFAVGGFMSMVLVATILDLMEATDSLKSSIYHHRKELDELSKLINDPAKFDK